MKNQDTINAKREEIRKDIAQALKDENQEAYSKALNDMMQLVAEELRDEYDDKISAMAANVDASALAARGVHMLTSEEKSFYQKLIESAKSVNPKQALEDANVTFPRTIIDQVFNDLENEHQLLKAVNFVNTTGLTEFITNTNGEQVATWGKLTDKIIKELLGGFEVKDVGLFKLSAFIPVCKSQLDLSPEWMDRFIRTMLYEAIANGLEVGIITGNGKESPIGMDKEVGDSVVVTGGVYPKKKSVKITDLSPQTFGNLLALLAMHPNGKSRIVSDVIMIVDPQDYYQKIMPATTVMAPDGTYRNNVLPYPTEIIQANALNRGTAIIGMKKKYFAGLGMEQGGRIEYSDQYQFLEDNRVYLSKLYANGFPFDNNAFIVLDISDLKPLTYKVESVTAPALSTNAKLSSLSLGSAVLSPAFSPETDTYTATTKNATNVIAAIPADAGANIAIKFGEEETENGAALAWEEGSNSVEITVTAADGSTTRKYKVTVTKSNG